VVVPAYNEKERLPGMLAEAVSFLADAFPEKPLKGSRLNGSASKPLGKGWEIIIVDDGSKDDTAEVALEWVKSRIELGEIGEDQIRVVVLQHNRGKGGAVTHGMRHARGRYAIFADADGASKFADLGPLLEKLRGVEKEGYGIAVGSRAHMVTTDAVVKVPSRFFNVLGAKIDGFRSALGFGISLCTPSTH
jgi:dolichyl-phosphate beta-glucosyltransferase